MKKLLKRAAISCFIVVLAILTWDCTARIVDRVRPERVPDTDNITTPEFPVLILALHATSGQVDARIVFRRHVADYFDKTKHTTFLVPADRLTTVNDQLSEGVCSSDGYYSGPGSVAVLRNANGTQYLKVTATRGSDHTYIGWYQATADTYVPKKFLHESAIARRVDSLMTGIPITIALWAIGFGTYRLMRSRRARP